MTNWLSDKVVGCTPTHDACSNGSRLLKYRRAPRAEHARAALETSGRCSTNQ
jgi:hypothetical protein